MHIEFLLSRSHRLCRFARRRNEGNEGNKGNLHPLCAALSAISALSAGLLVSHADSFYCPAEIKEIAEIIVTRPREVRSALSALSAGHYYLVRIVFIVPQSSALPLRSSKK